MKTADEWSIWIIAYLQQHPVATLAEATAQIKEIVEKVQDDATKEIPTIQ